MSPLKYIEMLKRNLMKFIYVIILCSSSVLSFAQGRNAEKIKSHAGDSLFSAGNWLGAINNYQESLKIDTGNGRVWYRLGAAYQNSKQFKKAIEAYKKSISQPGNIVPPVIIKASIAKAYSLHNDTTEALNVLADLVKNGYTNFVDLNAAIEYSPIRKLGRFTNIVQQAKSNAYPCLSNPNSRKFDFWVGEWDVFQTGTNFQVGKSRIDSAVAGCLILENWTATGNPDEGKSMNTFNAQTNQWEQFYVAAGGGILKYYNGEYKDGAMRFDGQGTGKTGNKLLFHLSYFNQSDHRVRQLLEGSTDNGVTWSTFYDFTYKKIQ